MKALFADEALISFTWAGTINKQCFKELSNTLAVMSNAIKRNIPNFDFLEFEKKIKIWLRHCNERLT